ncbi:hypothetical protein OHA40_04230 [Nocardia sp. NBC_00508]|uniref:hypothetical protein n=1 Tax=Nocardia sp. NBC_00508 TaxID=2975992 RepID=UPI002E80A862|nr:hypothetical protein [Nocardia sp. NBC_00508]WUD67368.1 hypothetical protein OHA40_04230 [Nocardia sp. NBC_00508]
MDTAALVLPEPVRVPRPPSVKFGFLRGIGNARPVVVAAGCLIVLQLAIRWWVADSGYFYWDDLILVGRAAQYSLWSTDLLLYDHDGHFMPLAFATAWAVTAVAPLSWAGPVVVLLVLQLAASLAVLRMLMVLVGVRWMILAPLAFYLFCPLTLPAFAWWAAALNALPLQIAVAWVIGDAMLLVQSGRRRYALSGIAVFAVALLFFEKSVIVPFVAFAVAALARYVEGGESPLRAVARRGAALWAGSGSVLACWLIGYLAVVGGPVPPDSMRELRDLLPGAASLGIVPALFGGPWVWERWLPSTPWADPPAWAVVSAWLALVVLVALSMRARLRVGPVWLTAAAYILVVQLSVALARGGPNTAAELMQSLRYFADVAVVLAAAGALMLRARPKPSFERSPASFPARRVAVAVMAVFLVSSLWSTYTFVQSWRAGPTRTYVTNVESALNEWDGTPLLEQEVPWNVLNPLAYPQNLTSRVLAPIAAPGAFADSTPHLRMITDSGEIVEASVWWNRIILPGPQPECGYRIHGTEPVQLLLDGPMFEHEWTAQLNYFADQDGRITVGFEHGRAVAAPVRKGANTVFVRIVGSGSALRIASRTTGLDLCVGVGPVGVASYDN